MNIISYNSQKLCLRQNPDVVVQSDIRDEVIKKKLLTAKNIYDSLSAQSNGDFNGHLSSVSDVDTDSQTNLASSSASVMEQFLKEVKVDGKECLLESGSYPDWMEACKRKLAKRSDRKEEPEPAFHFEKWVFPENWICRFYC